MKSGDKTARTSAMATIQTADYSLYHIAIPLVHLSYNVRARDRNKHIMVYKPNAPKLCVFISYDCTCDENNIL